MTFREARNCFVYDPHQWLNQGCVAVDTDGGSLGVSLNEKGGGVFVLEWDPVNSHIRSWVFSPHVELPENLVDAIRTASEPVVENRIMPDPDEWPLPYGYFPIGKYSCPILAFFSPVPPYIVFPGRQLLVRDSNLKEHLCFNMVPFR